MDITKQIATELQVRPAQVEAAVKLLDEGNTVPFISRYRKEATGGLNDEQLRALSERLTYLRNLEEKKATCLASIEEQGLLTDELKKAISIIEWILEEWKVKEEIESYRVHFDNFWEEALVINITYFSLLNDKFIDHLKQKEKINLEIKSEFEKAWLKMAMTGKFVQVKNV